MTLQTSEYIIMTWLLIHDYLNSKIHSHDITSSLMTFQMSHPKRVLITVIVIRCWILQWVIHHDLTNHEKSLELTEARFFQRFNHTNYLSCVCHLNNVQYAKNLETSKNLNVIGPQNSLDFFFITFTMLQCLQFSASHHSPIQLFFKTLEKLADFFSSERSRPVVFREYEKKLSQRLLLQIAQHNI